MKDRFANLCNIKDFIFSKSFNSNFSSIVLLSSRSWVEATLVENNQVLLVLFKDVVENSNNLCVEIHSVAISVV